jgi:hypothetical protein
VDVDLAPGEGVERVREAVREHDCEDAVVVVKITGDGDPVSPAAVEELAIDRGALVARVNDRREFAEEGGVDVSFADPDEAVRERVRELGLSQAARDIDETVRASKTADSNVREEVTDRIRELADGDLDAFESVENADDGIDTDDGTDTDDREEAADGSGGTGETEASVEATDGGAQQRSMEDYR